MGNAPSSHHPTAVTASGAEPEKLSEQDTTSADVVNTAQEKSELEKQAASSSSDRNKAVGDAASASSSPILGAGNFNPNVISIQTLGSGSGPTDDAGVYNIIDTANPTVGQTLGAALGGVAGVGGNAASGDALLSTLPKDMNSSVLGGQLVAIGRLWPGS